VPICPRSGGFWPTFSPPKGGVGHRPVHGQPLPVNALHGRICQQTLLPEGQEDPGLRPLLEAARGGTAGTNAWVMQGLPWAPGPEDEEDGSHGPASIDPWPVAPEGGGGFRGGSNGWMRSHHSSGIRQSRRTFSWSSLLG
jgi:hypothetical protein